MATEEDMIIAKGVNHLIKQIIESGGHEANLSYTWSGIPIEVEVKLLSVGGILTPSHPDYDPSIEDEDDEH